MTADTYPIHDHVSPIQRIARVFRDFVRRVNAIDLQYIDPWERRRR